MKSLYWLFIIVFTTFLFSCSKDKLNNNKLTGTWELTEVYIAWTGIKTFPNGNGNTFLFKPNGVYIQTTNNSDTSYTIQNNYTLSNKNTCGGNMILTLHQNNDIILWRITISNDSLYLNNGNCIADANSYIYLKK